MKITFKQHYSAIIILIVSISTVQVYGQVTQYGGSYQSSMLHNKQWFLTQIKSPTPLYSSDNNIIKKIYLSSDLDKDGLADEGQPTYLRNNFIHSGDKNTYRLVFLTALQSSYVGSTVEYYSPNSNIANILSNGITYPLESNLAWYRWSKIAPLNQYVRAVESLPILFEIPSSKKKTDAFFQLKFHIRTVSFRSFNHSLNSDYQVMPVPNLDYDGPANESWYLSSFTNSPMGSEWAKDYTQTKQVITVPKIQWSVDELNTESPVIEYRFSWCGDGDLDANETFENGTFSEECDPADPLKKNWGISGCDCNCKKNINTISKPKVWAVCVGISDYAQELNNQGLNDLTFSHIDAEQVFSFLKSAEGGAVPSNQISLLINSNATKENILQACNRIFQQATKDDLIIFYFSGHGGENLFCTYDGSIGHNDLKNIIYTSKAKKKLCVADACHAGSWNKNSTYASKTLNQNQTANMYYEALGNSGDGIALFMASQTDETSIDDKDLKQGLFTYYYLEGLKGNADANYDRIITLQELYDYVKKKVSTRGLARWNNPQNPVLNGTFDHSMPVGIRSN